MTARCIDCGAEVEEGPLCNDCAPLVTETLKRLKGKQTRPNYTRNQGPRKPPRVTLTPIKFTGKTP